LEISLFGSHFPVLEVHIIHENPCPWFSPVKIAPLSFNFTCPYPEHSIFESLQGSTPHRTINGGFTSDVFGTTQLSYTFQKKKYIILCINNQLISADSVKCWTLHTDAKSNETGKSSTMAILQFFTSSHCAYLSFSSFEFNIFGINSNST